MRYLANSAAFPKNSASSISQAFQRNFEVSIAPEARELLSPLYQQDAGGSE